MIAARPLDIAPRTRKIQPFEFQNGFPAQFIKGHRFAIRERMAGVDDGDQLQIRNMKHFGKIIIEALVFGSRIVNDIHFVSSEHFYGTMVVLALHLQKT